MGSREAKVKEILRSLYLMRHSLMKGYSARQKLGITPSQGAVLHSIAQTKQTNVKSIAHELNISSSAATQLIDSLVHKGFLIRQGNPLDRRETSLSLSPKAKKKFCTLKKHGLKKMTQIFDVFTDAELEQYAALHNKLIEGIRINKSS